MRPRNVEELVTHDETTERSEFELWTKSSDSEFVLDGDLEGRL
jgi:hypothetical protein